MIIRHPQPDEAGRVLALFEDEVRAGRMLPRSEDNFRAHVEDWLIAEQAGQVVGCVSLVYFNQELCEVRSLAVHPDYRGNGVASKLVSAAIDMAREHDMRRVLTLTRAPRLFEHLGFVRDFVDNFPEKVWQDCAPCPFRDACDEVALIYHLHRQEKTSDGK
ncbi:MAG: GNAT family N-acetyltransferase [Anaerolineae bacterium]|nr:GNAT family N-acetyltransferase [Anaerolineae bacterium]